MNERSLTWLGLGAFACYAVHGAYHLTHHRTENLLWCCHVGAVAVSAGLLARSAAVNAVGLLLMFLGLFLWITDLASGGEFIPTSPVTHLGGLAIAIAGARKLGIPRWAWLEATGVLLALHVLSRYLTTPEENVNLAFAIHPSLSRFFSSHDAYIATLTGGLGLAILGLQQLLVRTGVAHAA